MTVKPAQIDRLDMDDFTQNARPTRNGITDSLALLRKRAVPFSDAELSNRLDLLLLPFLGGTLDQRVSRLQAALELAANRLSPAYELVYRRILLDPTGNVTSRREHAVKELGERFPAKRGNETPSINSIERRLLPMLANILLDPEFERELDSEHPKPKRIVPSRPTLAFQVLSANLAYEIDNEDNRKSILHRVNHIEALLPDQRVVTIRYHTRASNPLPVDDGVVMLSDGHTYLGTLPDSQHGAIADWMLQFVYLGARMEPGDRTCVEMSTEFFDEAKSDNHPCVTFTVDHRNVRKIDLAIRLPKDRRAEATAEYRIIKNPHSNSIVIDDGRLPITEDGWVRTEFTNPEAGLQYGIFLPDFDLYK